MKQIAEKYGIMQVETCLNIFNQQIKLEKEDIERNNAITADFKKRKEKIYTLKDQIFSKVNIDEIFAERERQAELFKQQQQRAAEEAKRKESNAIPRSTLTNMSNDVKTRYAKDQQEKKER